MKDTTKKVTQKNEVLEVLKHARTHRLWLSLHDITVSLPGNRSETSVAADLRNLRKNMYGAHKIERRYNAGRAVNEFQLTEETQESPVTVEAAIA